MGQDKRRVPSLLQRRLGIRSEMKEAYRDEYRKHGLDEDEQMHLARMLGLPQKTEGKGGAS